MANEANLERGGLENCVDNMENTLKELMASFQSRQATIVTRAPLVTNPLFEENVLVVNFPMAISTLTLGKEPTSSCPPNPTIGGTSGTKPFDLNAGVATVQSNDQEKTQVVKSITEDEDKTIKTKVQLMEETLKSMQGVQTNKPVDISSLCFFPNIQLPHKFKLPEFDKYNGTSCPYAHLTMYYRKMAPYANDEKLMIHYFQDSLTSLVDAWFSTLDKSKFVVVGEQVEDGIKSGIIIDYQAMKSLLEQYQNDSSGVSSSKKVGQNQKKENENGNISSVYEAYGRNNQSPGFITLVTMVPLNPPFPIWYNPQARCEYHSGGVGPDLENCLALKHRVQHLIEAKELQIASEPEVVGPNITKNSLPTHDGPTVNMIEKDSDKGHEVTTSTNNDGLSTSFEKLSICVIDEGKGDDKLILPTHGEALDNKTVEILLVPIIKP
ncbi:hypothetical protein SLEP1_g44117 [Rubroshorea leprosula]|uniref:Gag-pro-like protein n=1 Tax=Rubroshorea leprosula TaxID=152421 RepID=A0AAV5LF60_9ROSI|nr:hypothetical protein SLEP1_g44117 [Rubroshorea leprosula]